MAAPVRLAIIATHPIQHFVPFYRALAAGTTIDPCVLFGSQTGLTPYFDLEMQSEITWQMDLLGGYPHKFLSGADSGSQPSFRQPNSSDLGESLAAFAPEAVLVYGYAQINALRALFWCRRRQVPALIVSDSERLRPRSAWKNLVKGAILPTILGRFSAALSVGDQNEAYYRSYGVDPARIFRCPFTIDEAAYRAARADRSALRAATRAAHGIDPEAVVALFVGKLSPRKRPQDLIDAIARLPGRPVHALFAGHGELLEPLRQAARDRGIAAHFPGFVNVDALPAVYAAADMLVHPSEADPHPLVCSEAACMGMPMILSDRIGCLGPTDIAREGQNALRYGCGDIGALARAIDALAAAPDRREDMGRRSLAIFDEQDVRHSVAGLERALQMVTGR